MLILVINKLDFGCKQHNIQNQQIANTVLDGVLKHTHKTIGCCDK